MPTDYSFLANMSKKCYYCGTLRKGKRKQPRKDFVDDTRVNEEITATEVRLIDADGENIGVIALSEALQKARAAELDLIEVGAQAKPPVAKIMDYGKYRYEMKKKAQQVRAKSHTTETKSVQIKVGTGEHDLGLKAARSDKWLTQGHRVKIELYLRGRTKYMEKEFLHGKLESFVKLLTEDYKVADPIKKCPKGLMMVVEKA